ncbi:MAG: clostripain-related cysteine peptidase [Myxococcota bacterium]
MFSALLACRSPESHDTAPARAAAERGSTVTVAVWMAADNDLERLVPNDLDELEGGASDRVSIVVQLDRVPGYLTAQGDWAGTKRLEIVPDTEPGPVSSVVEDLGEVNMGDGDALAEFLTWADARHPSDRFVVVLWNHGGGYWIASDDTDGDELDVNDGELSRALQVVVDQRGQKVDVVAFDACNMGEWEVAYALRDQAQVMTASAAWVGSAGYAYDAAFAELPLDADAHTLGERLVWSAGELNGELTQAAVDLDALPALTDAIDGLAGAYLASPGGVDTFLAARDAAQGMDLTWEQFWMDVGEIGRASAELDPALAPHADAIDQALEAVVFARYTQPAVAFASGLTLFSDTSNPRWLDKYRGGPWADTRWDDWLDQVSAAP